ncbi:unnamed protein product [Rotaria sp. Silwood2]|nr:unnamed protein product [Rotaria sp. Silwood2]
MNTSQTALIESLSIQCISTESTFVSTLECLYNQSCLNLIRINYARYGIDNLTDIPSLDENVGSVFSINDTIETLVYGLLLENLTVNVSYDQFYAKCSPLSCIYTIQESFNLFFLITSIVAIYSILNKIFRLILPSLIQLAFIIWNRIRKQDSSVNQSASIVEVTQRNVPTISYRIQIQEYIRTLNLFQTEFSTNDTRRQEIISTRLYLGLVITFTILLFLYTGLIERTTTIMVPTPSISSYVSLQERYSDTLQCPCSTISIPYQEFIIYLNATFHPICSRSDFLSAWHNYFYRYRTTIVYWIHSDDFRSWAIVFFNFLEKYCEQATITVADVIEQFKSDLFVSSEVMFPILFETQIEMILKLFQKSTSILFARQLQMFRNISVGHGLISNLGINIELKLDRIAVDAPVLVIPKTYKNGTCSCATSSNCVELASFYNRTHDIVYTIEKIYTGCFILESILHSSLTCFFSNSCMIDLMSATNLGNPNLAALTEIMDISPLEFASPISNFNINDTIETMVYQLFIDSWSNETSYERYYNACAPIKCIYLKEKRLNVIYAVTIFLTVINGLLLGLRSVVPLFVRLLYKLGNRIRTLCS